MGHETYAQMIERLVEVRDGDYRSDPERHEARLDSLESIMLALLERLRDQHEAPAAPIGVAFSDPLRNVIRPIAFDEKRKGRRREKARVAQRRRRGRDFEIGGELYLHSFMLRMIREPWDIEFKGDDGNDNFIRRMRNK